MPTGIASAPLERHDHLVRNDLLVLGRAIRQFNRTAVGLTVYDDDEFALGCRRQGAWLSQDKRPSIRLGEPESLLADDEVAFDTC